MSDTATRREHKASASFPRNAKAGALALMPQAFGWLFFEPFEAPETEVRDDGIAVVRISGPLEHHESFYSDSYHAIRSRFDTALAAKPRGVLLYINSPGGLVEGCFELAQYMHDAASRAGVPLFAYGEGIMCSAAYALACAAQRIGASKTTLVGSIGVIDCLVDASALDEAWGVKYRLITSGARKADGNPHQPTDDGAIVATQQRVDDLAAHFFEWVGAARPALGADGARAFEAGVLVGSRALGAGLLDLLGDPSVLLTELSPEKPTMPQANDDKPADDTKPSDGDMYRKLRKMADEGDEDAKKMLQRLEGGDDEGGSDDEKKKGDEATARSASTSRAEQIAAQALATAERAERLQLIASRPDLDESTRELLMSAPLDKVRAHVAKAPKRVAPDRAASAQPGVRPTAQPQGTRKPALALTPAATEADRARVRLASRLLGHTSTVVGARVEHDTATGRPSRVEFGVDIDASEADHNPDRLASARIRGSASPLGATHRVD